MTLALHALVAELRDRRYELGWTQQAVARRLHVSQNAVSQWESGRSLPPLDRLESYAAVLGLRVALIPADAVKDAVRLRAAS
ncbi:helix-turn-helix domain-containing protein [Nonomuraea sp. NPDC004702]